MPGITAFNQHKSHTFMSQTKTPCLGICSTTSVGDFVCRGCKRYAFEVINWVTYAETEKRAVMMRIEKLTSQIVETKFQIQSVTVLAAGLDKARIPFDDSLSPYCWVHNLLKRYHLKTNSSLQSFGLNVRPKYQHLAIGKLAEMVDEELLTLSKAHFDRFMEGPAQIKGTVESA